MKTSLSLLLILLSQCIASSAEASCKDAGARLNRFATADQQIRQEWEALNQDARATEADKAALQERMRTIDARNLKQLQEIIEVCGWPADRKASHTAWLLTQHADADLAFQKKAKDLLEASVKAGIGAPADLAYLADRIASNENRPQEYGTQFMQTDRCTLKLLPVDDIELVNRRRLAIGLQSIEEYEAEGRKRLIPADCAK